MGAVLMKERGKPKVSMKLTSRFKDPGSSQFARVI